MDKQTLSIWGWTIVIALVIAVMLAAATPLGKAVNDRIVNMVDDFGSSFEDAQEHIHTFVYSSNGENSTHTGTCSSCGKTITEEHDYTLDKSRSTEATCTENGSKIYSCNVCNQEKTEVVDLGGHSFSAYLSDGINSTHTRTCSRCGETEKANHAYVLDASRSTESTCTENGSKTYSCNVCNQEKTEVVALLDHAWGEGVYVEPTCTENGYTINSCGRCGQELYDEYPAPGHDYETTYVAPTCTEAGYTSGSCIRCGDSTYVEHAATGHHNSGWQYNNPTCTTGGYFTFSCSVCGASWSDDFWTEGPLGHTPVDGGTADCHTRCNRCGEILSSDHSMAGFVVAEPSCTSTGSVLYECDCGYSYWEETGPNDHSYIYQQDIAWDDNGYIIVDQCYGERTCSVCGYTEVGTVVGDKYNVNIHYD